jgi:hypothetical protein
MILLWGSTRQSESLRTHWRAAPNLAFPHADLADLDAIVTQKKPW